MSEEVFALVRVADEDLEEAESALSRKKFRYACYFAQQAVEKYLKAYLLFRKNEYPFVHSIAFLIRECSEFDKDFERLFEMGAHRLGKYYTMTRYMPLVELSEENAREAIQVAREVRDFVLKKLKLGERGTDE